MPCRHCEAAVDLGGPLRASVGHPVSQLWHWPHCHQDVRQAARAVQHGGLPGSSAGLQTVTAVPAGSH